MDKVFVGKVVNTHGIKGEIRIKSDFELKDKVFLIGNEIIIGTNNYIINSYRVHKEYDMITLKNFDDINQVIPLKGQNVYIRRDFLGLNDGEYVLSDLINMEVILDNEVLGIVKDYENTINPLLIVEGNKRVYIPIKGNFIKNVDVSDNKIYVTDDAKGLIL